MAFSKSVPRNTDAIFLPGPALREWEISARLLEEGPICPGYPSFNTSDWSIGYALANMGPVHPLHDILLAGPPGLYLDQPPAHSIAEDLRTAMPRPELSAPVDIQPAMASSTTAAPSMDIQSYEALYDFSDMNTSSTPSRHQIQRHDSDESRREVGSQAQSEAAIKRRNCGRSSSSLAEFSCPRCEKTFTRKKNLLGRLSVVYSWCEEQGADAVADHQLRHDNQKRYPCNEGGCASRFNTRSDLDRHMKTVHKVERKGCPPYSRVRPLYSHL